MQASLTYNPPVHGDPSPAADEAKLLSGNLPDGNPGLGAAADVRPGFSGIIDAHDVVGPQWFLFDRRCIGPRRPQARPGRPVAGPARERVEGRYDIAP